MSELIRVDPRWPGAWYALKGFLADALEKGNGGKDWSLDDIRAAAIEGHVALWGLVKNNGIYGAGVTTVTQYPRRRVLEVLALGCEKDTEELWRPLLDHLRGLAQSLGCSAIIGTGRPGWGRKLGAAERRIFEIEIHNAGSAA